MHRFIRKITRKPVLTKQGDLREGIVKVIDKLRASGKDPIKEFENCRDYLENAIDEMNRNKDLYCKWELYGHKKFTPGTKASLVYMLKGVKIILQKLAIEELDRMMGLKPS